MPSKSENQRKFFALALAYKRGEVSDVSGMVKKAAKSMTVKQLEDYAEKIKEEFMSENLIVKNGNLNRQFNIISISDFTKLVKAGKVPAITKEKDETGVGAALAVGGWPNSATEDAPVSENNEVRLQPGDRYKTKRGNVWKVISLDRDQGVCDIKNENGERQDDVDLYHIEFKIKRGDWSLVNKSGRVEESKNDIDTIFNENDELWTNLTDKNGSINK